MNWHIHGHNWAVNLLSIHAQGEKLRHAYLFTGPSGIGRRTLALRFAEALNCTNPPAPGTFCHKCRSCRQIQSQTHPDLSILQPEEGHRDLLIDQVRSLQHSLALAPYMGKYRIALLPDFQRATTSAANAMLKTLEEPPEKVILILTANALEDLLPTIVSRCEVLRLHPESIKTTQNILKTEKGLAAVDAQLLAHLSGGRIGYALKLADSPDALSQRQDGIEKLLNLLPAPRYERFQLAEKLSKPYDQARQRLADILPIWLSFWRDVFIECTGSESPLINIDYHHQIQEISAELTLERVRSLMIAHEKATRQLEQNANVRLLTETLLLRWPRLTHITSPK